MTMQDIVRDFVMVDVFANGPFTGNPLPVLRLERDADTATLQAITRWFNLSETAFLLPPDDPAADYRVRIFTLDRELPFAGHPTLGACHAWTAMGGTPKSAGRIVQQCGIGLVELAQFGDTIGFAAPPLIRSGPVDGDVLARALAILRLDAEQVEAAAWADNGPGWLGLILRDADAVLAVDPVRALGMRAEFGLIGRHAPGGPADWEIRTLFTDAAGMLIEDPVTGSFNAAAALWLKQAGHVSGDYVARQGTAIGRDGRIFVRYAGDVTWICGRAVTCFDGRVVAAI
ncbi:PhzF family phenazine biosynthesis protein [Sphingomonas sp. BGYR3]|uniref:PhzF family phenazine biosynthesis protein n=1 Tax=Sphingomonas sp. BGYR3 TaxID=2975483 RepID=UPI0021A2FCA6|nr:PhzF family phenazine biosynthesis protein [Sphingomonas sp. BGYR3]MDG5489707.1 PhzF family phenazine biosynthesis protein [Sphingomonas sp. BGYR3]